MGPKGLDADGAEMGGEVRGWAALGSWTKATVQGPLEWGLSRAPRNLPVKQGSRSTAACPPLLPTCPWLCPLQAVVQGLRA